MELTDTQKKTVGEWAREGCSLSEIQKRLAGQFGISLTYMEIRLLIIDLGLQVKDKKVESASSTDIAAPSEPTSRDSRFGVESEREEAAVSSGGVSVSVDKITKPGAIVSGTVNFTDGTSARWFIDQLGRLALEAGQPGYRPSPADIQAFQQAVAGELEKRGV